MAPATPNQRFVNQVYNDVLDRPADGGASSWVSRLDRRAINRSDVALAFTTSTEYITAQIQAAYRTTAVAPAEGIPVEAAAAATYGGPDDDHGRR